MIAINTRSKFIIPLAFVFSCATSPTNTTPGNVYQEPHRPQIHFTPEAHWMNDPNGMVYYNNTYHLFYQYYPDSTVWGPMHWGHATSTDLVHWEHQPIALYPDSLGYIFSGSAVADINNTSGFGTDGKTPLVAIYTNHDPIGEKEGSNTFQNQSIAYSNDDGKTWTKYAGNPVLKNPGIRDFRDPKVSWYTPENKWIMTLATQDRVTFFSSPNLKEWTRESDFGSQAGAHGGVWECPDLFPLTYQGKKLWILFVSINPGGPNLGSATQYFVGDFDGKSFTPIDTLTKWIDYGPDDYAGVTWSNTGDRKIFLGWMSNWQYANLVPTEKWRSATTIPRELNIDMVDGHYYVRSAPVKELDKLSNPAINFENIDIQNYDLTKQTSPNKGPAVLHLQLDKTEDFSIELSNATAEKLVLGFNKADNKYFIDRTKAGKTDFEKTFGGRYTAPRLSIANSIDLTLYIDDASIELFADHGLSVMTAIFFPTQNFSNITMQAPNAVIANHISFSTLRSIYR